MITAFFQQVVANAVFASRPLTGGGQRGNLVDDYDGAGDYLTAPYGHFGELDLFPKTRRLGWVPIDLSEFVQYRQWNRDFNGVLRGGRFPGAYGGEGVNPGWRLELERKPLHLESIDRAGPVPPEGLQ